MCHFKRYEQVCIHDYIRLVPFGRILDVLSLGDYNCLVLSTHEHLLVIGPIGHHPRGGLYLCFSS